MAINFIRFKLIFSLKNLYKYLNTTNFARYDILAEANMKSEVSFVFGEYESFIDETAAYIFMSENSVVTCLQTYRTSYPRNPYPSIFWEGGGGGCEQHRNQTTMTTHTQIQ